jgi:hypothetical protein
MNVGLGFVVLIYCASGDWLDYRRNPYGGEFQVLGALGSRRMTISFIT